MIQFEYEISADDYVASQILYYKLSEGNKRIKRAGRWILLGVSCIVVALNGKVLDWTPILLVGIGGWWIYAGMTSLFPGRYFRRMYPRLTLAGRRFQAEVNSEGFEVVGDVCSWKVQWAGVTLKGENERVFILCSEGTIFMFGKKYLTVQQQQELRKIL